MVVMLLLWLWKGTQSFKSLSHFLNPLSLSMVEESVTSSLDFETGISVLLGSSILLVTVDNFGLLTTLCSSILHPTETLFQDMSKGCKRKRLVKKDDQVLWFGRVFTQGDETLVYFLENRFNHILTWFMNQRWDSFKRRDHRSHLHLVSWCATGEKNRSFFWKLTPNKSRRQAAVETRPNSPTTELASRRKTRFWFVLCLVTTGSSSSPRSLLIELSPPILNCWRGAK